MKKYIHTSNKINRNNIPYGIHMVTTHEVYKKDNTKSSGMIYIKFHDIDLEGYMTPFKDHRFKMLSIEEQINGITFYINVEKKISENGNERRQISFYGRFIIKTECNIIKYIKQLFAKIM